MEAVLTDVLTRRSVRLSLAILLLAVVAALAVWFSPAAEAATQVDAAASAIEVIDEGTETDAADEPLSYRQTNRLLQNIVNGFSFGLLLALASVGLSLIYGTTKLSNFAHGEQVTLGAVFTYLFTDQGMPFVYAALLGIALAASTGYLQDWGIWSRLRKRRVGNVQQMIVSIGLSLALVNIIQMVIGSERVRLTRSIEERYPLGPVDIGQQTLVSTIIALAALGGVAYFLLRTRLGRATRAVSDNAALASASGITVNRIIRLVWIMATALAGLGGILLAVYENTTDFGAGGRILLLMFAAVTLGGLGHPFGALVGSIIIGMAAEVSTVWLAPDLKYAVALAILIIVLLVRPQGILGRVERVG